MKSSLSRPNFCAEGEEQRHVELFTENIAGDHIIPANLVECHFLVHYRVYLRPAETSPAHQADAGYSRPYPARHCRKLDIL